MPRFFLPEAGCSGSILSLDASQTHHAVTVLRLRPGDPATILDGQGHLFHCRVLRASRKSVSLEVFDRKNVSKPASRMSLVQSVLKHKAMEQVIQAATELGVAAIAPVIATRSIPRIGSAQVDSRLLKWELAVVAAMKQSGLAWKPTVHLPKIFDAFFPRDEAPEISLFASLDAGAWLPRAVLRTFRKEKGRPPETVEIWVGPEGDFTPRESRLLTEAGTVPISLGETVLRSETAAIAAIAIIKHELLDPPGARRVPASTT